VAVFGLQHQLTALRSDVITCYGSTPWLADALRQNGFFRRGKTAFYLRDPQNRVRLDQVLHLTHLEADAAYV
jgi:hypothetical protein